MQQNQSLVWSFSAGGVHTNEHELFQGSHGAGAVRHREDMYRRYDISPGNVAWPCAVDYEPEFNSAMHELVALVKNSESPKEGIFLDLSTNLSNRNWLQIEIKKKKQEIYFTVRVDALFLDFESTEVRTRYLVALVQHALKYQMLVLKHFYSGRLLAYFEANPIAPDLQVWVDQVSANWDYALSAAGRAEERLREEICQRAVSMYKKEGDILWFAQSYALDDQKAYLLHGKVGEKGLQSSVEVAAGQTIEQLLFALVKPFHEQKYKRLKEHTLTLEMDVVGNEVQALAKQHEMADLLDEWSGWNGLGSVEGSSIGSGTMEIFFNVCDVELGKGLLKDFIELQGWKGIRVLRD